MTAVAAVLALPVLALLWLAVVGWNWARGPLQDRVLAETGRELRIVGDLDLDLAWPAPRLHAQRVSFANPAWAAVPQMVAADAVSLTIDLPALLRGRLAFPEVRLTRPLIALEHGTEGRRTWLLDLAQTDETRVIPIGRVLLDQGTLTYTDPAEGTALQAALSTADAAGDAAYSLGFQVAGQFRGQPLSAEGRGGAVLALRDETKPYPLRVKGTVGPTQVEAEGSVTSLLRLTAVDLQLALRGDSAASLFPLIGIALPRTPAYRTAGHLLRSGAQWRYEGFTGRVGRSDLSGTLQLDTASARPRLSGALASPRLDLADLGPAVGAHAQTPAKPARVLPDLPFDTRSWTSLDADVTLRAQALLRPAGVPLENLDLRLQLQDARLTLDPLDFGLAGGRMKGRVTLDGRATPLRGHATVQLRGVKLAELLPKASTGQTALGRLDGDIDLAGQGPSVGRMLATADGRVSLVAQNGEISRLLVEQMGLHLLEILQLTLTGDQTIKLNCAVADFGVSGGRMQARALVLDTAVNTLVGSGHINLADETLDLTLQPRTKVTSLVALRSPIHVTGRFDRPVVTLDTGRLAARSAGALLLGLVNPLLALIPLLESGPGTDSECGRLVAEARAALPKTKP
jgi:AsmA protein